MLGSFQVADALKAPPQDDEGEQDEAEPDEIPLPHTQFLMGWARVLLVLDKVRRDTPNPPRSIGERPMLCFYADRCSTCFCFACCCRAWRHCGRRRW